MSRFTLGNFFNILVLNEVHVFVVKAVQQYPENAALQISALSCLALLSESPHSQELLFPFKVLRAEEPSSSQEDALRAPSVGIHPVHVMYQEPGKNFR